MHVKYQKAVEGRPEGTEILRLLGITDSDKFDKAKLAAIEQTVKALNDGADLKTAVNGAIATAKGSLTVTQPEGGIVEAPDMKPRNLEAPLKEQGRSQAFDLINQIGEYSQSAKAEIGQGLEGFVKGSVYAGASEAFESKEWQDAALEAIRSGKPQT